MSVRYRLAALAAGLVAVAGLIATSGVGTASADLSTTYKHLCTLSETVCAQAEGSGNQVGTIGPHTPGWTNWYYPVSGYQPIIQADTDQCMEVDAKAGDTVIESGCDSSASFQLWKPSSTNEYVSKYDSTKCLTKSGTKLFISKCANNTSTQEWQLESGD
jgi:hypothetical protein